MQDDVVPGFGAPAVEKVPAAHTPVHAAVVLPPRPYVPALHGEHAVLFIALQLPGGHTAQPDDGADPHPAVDVHDVVPTLGVP